MILLILDGWGYTDNTNYNAIHNADKPNWERVWNECPRMLINASGLDVGLPAEQMGNSEVGHMNIGSGRLIDQEFTRISRAIEDGSFYKNETLVEAFQQAAENNKAVHLLGLLSDGGVHSHEDHLFALLEMANDAGVENIYIHGFLDGRDTPPKCATEHIARMNIKIREIGNGQIASIVGRHYSMDRNKEWDRTQMAYDLITQGKGEFQAPDAFIGLEMAYDRGETDEFVLPTAIIKPGEDPVRVEDGDVMIFANYRADRARQLARAFIRDEFTGFERDYMPHLGNFISLTVYKANYEFPVAFPPEPIRNVFGEYIAKKGLKQLRIAETEKYAHVTFFFNGGEEHVFEGEDRILIPSPHVRTYDEKPEMSVYEVTDRILESILDEKYDAIICNFANTDMVGHTGNYEAAMKAVSAVDECIGKILSAARVVGGEVILTADHGNAEQMRTYTTEKVKSQPHTAHTTNLVPFIYVGRPASICHEEGALCDVIPSMLYLMGLEIPEEMTGNSLLKLKDE